MQVHEMYLRPGPGIVPHRDRPSKEVLMHRCTVLLRYYAARSPSFKYEYTRSARCLQGPSSRYAPRSSIDRIDFGCFNTTAHGDSAALIDALTDCGIMTEVVYVFLPVNETASETASMSGPDARLLPRIGAGDSAKHRLPGYSDLPIWRRRRSCLVWLVRSDRLGRVGMLGWLLVVWVASIPSTAMFHLTSLPSLYVIPPHLTSIARETVAASPVGRFLTSLFTAHFLH
ncbi:hypothetical protein EDC01DRAFT_469625 [Geopyxis carbonaria]|nr:hypothetical protein EDC01DRAFT_469625 [Geopyxis carbonaria]